MATIKTRTAAEIEAVIAGVDAGHRMAFHEPTDEMRETGRQILRGEISADDAVAASIAKLPDAADKTGTACLTGTPIRALRCCGTKLASKTPASR